jgi:ribose 5-phosphate isomerase B
MTTVALGSDHAGYAVKERIKEHLRQHHPEWELRDCGTTDESSVDYPDFGHRVSGLVSTGEAARGVLVCGAGIGMSIVANRHRGVRAALCHNGFTARMARLHNDANILVVGGRVLGTELILEMVDIFLGTDFEGGRHVGRVAKMETPECEGDE